MILLTKRQQIQQNQFDSPPDDFFQEEPMNKEAMQLQEESINKELQEESIQVQQEAVQDESMNKEELQEESMQVQEKAINKTSKNEELTHEENKLLLTLLGITLGSVIMWTLR